MSPQLITKKYSIFIPYKKNFAMNLNNLQKPIKDSIAQIDFNNKAVAVQLISFPRSTTCNIHENELWGVT